MKILVLGGTGAMGSELVRLAAEENNDVYVTSRGDHKSELGNVAYIQGDALSKDFLNSLLNTEHYDAIIDFMSYTIEVFKNRVQLFLDHTDQYVFLSSSRVYADSIILTEKSERLLDTCLDSKYLATDEYALAKARQEDLLFKSGRLNWTVIRPYITYNTNRMQLGFLEKEQWLNRAMNGRPIVISADILEHETTLTFGGDVAKGIYSIIGKKTALGEIFQISSDYHLKWKDVLGIYCDVIAEETRNRPDVIMEESYTKLAKVIGREYQAEYDRLYNRVFDSSKIKQYYSQEFQYTSPDVGIRYCLHLYISSGTKIKQPDWRYEGFCDKVAKLERSISSIPGFKNKAKYLIARYTQYFEKRGS